MFNAKSDLDRYIPHVIPHLEGHAFWYHGMVMHQMILGQNFRRVITGSHSKVMHSSVIISGDFGGE